MRSIVIYSADKKRRDILAAVLNTVTDFRVHVVATTTATISYLKDKQCDTLIIDTNYCGMAVTNLLEWCKTEHPSTWRILLREDHISASYRLLLTHVHGSIQIPSNRIELRRFVERLAKDFPQQKPVPTTSSPSERKITIQERIFNILSDFTDSIPTLQELSSIIASDPDLAKMILNRINSPFYGLTTRIVSPDRAILMLGSQGTLNCLAESLTENEPQVA